MPDFITCPACNCRNIKIFNYAEGNIYSCQCCPLQWANRNPEMFPEIVENPDSLYMKPESIINPANYRPYNDFFTTSEAILGKRNLRILDVGCGSGVFVGRCLELGHEVKGIERDKLLAKFMPQQIKDRVIFKSAEELSDKEGLFDIITFWDSFEHIDDPFKVIRTTSQNLAENGIIFLRVNNRRDVYNFAVSLTIRLLPETGRKMLKSCFNFPDHVWNFSEIPMRQMLEKNGFSVKIFRPDDTPADRLTRNRLLQNTFKLAYLFNKVIGGGKIGEYYLYKKI